MRPKSSSTKKPAEQVVKDIRRATWRHFSAEDKIRIVLDGLCDDDSIAELCRKEGIAQSLYYVWSKESLEAGKRRLAGDTARAATTDEVKDLRRIRGHPQEPWRVAEAWSGTSSRSSSTGHCSGLVGVAGISVSLAASRRSTKSCPRPSRRRQMERVTVATFARN